MLKQICLLLASLAVPVIVRAQTNCSKKADSLYAAKIYESAGRYYLLSEQEEDFLGAKQNALYNAACSFALAGKADSAMLLLSRSVKYGNDNVAHIKTDNDLSSLHDRADWQKLIANIHPRKKSTNIPTKAKLITTDVRNFWDAYDRAQKDTINRLAIYRKYYIDRGTPGLQDYFTYKITKLKYFVKGHDSRPKFYAAIRKNTYQVEQQKPQMIASFVKLKELYDKAMFPDVYFIIGDFSSGGTSTDNGLLIGLDQCVRTPDIPTDELNLWQRNNFSKLENLPYMIAHELIHFNQGGMASDTTLLHAVLIEGSADFIGELISGNIINQRQHEWAKGKEKQIMADFEKEMYLNRTHNWIANSDQETEDKPADLGYWVGYQICKAYYHQAADKKQAITDMLNIKDYRAFYNKSGVNLLF
ncbi:TPR end-of-group domain-containing protein [Mucilaginibacter sp. 22184]|uniref:gliding motility protein GldB-related protein n=1 Tax=Mucilaginibacter sp. 22184 TaxID=3453887 RepID=UPI003F874201